MFERASLAGGTGECTRRIRWGEFKDERKIRRGSVRRRLKEDASL